MKYVIASCLFLAGCENNPFVEDYTQPIQLERARVACSFLSRPNEKAQDAPDVSVSNSGVNRVPDSSAVPSDKTSPASLDAQSIEWYKDYRQALDKAESEKKYLLIHFETEDCAPCKLMDKNVFTDSGVANIFKDSIVALKIDANSSEYDDWKLANKDRVPYEVLLKPPLREYQWQGFPEQNVEAYLKFLKTQLKGL